LTNYVNWLSELIINVNNDTVIKAIFLVGYVKKSKHLDMNKVKNV